MTMTPPTSHQQRFGPPLNLNYASHAQPPAFSNPWSSSALPPQSAAPAGASLYAAGQQQAHGLLAAKPQPPARAGSASASSMASYASLPVATAPAGEAAPLPHDALPGALTSSADMMAMNRLHTTSAAYGDATYTSSASPVGGHFAPTSGAPYEALGYAPAPSRQSTFAMSPAAERRFSQQQSVSAGALGRRAALTGPAGACRPRPTSGEASPTRSTRATVCSP